ncbi:hypothetical protein [Ethanoligenens sp.]|uniref:hypothetical protein n=1 Tax=Ethanoligenens sp. TaxID=2099655 RepID=UPI0039E7E97A
MDTRFEINIKKVWVKGDDRALYLFFDGKLALKLEYKDIGAAVKFLIKKANEQQLSSDGDITLPAITIKSEDKE